MKNSTKDSKDQAYANMAENRSSTSTASDDERSLFSSVRISQEHTRKQFNETDPLLFSFGDTDSDTASIDSVSERSNYGGNKNSGGGSGGSGDVNPDGFYIAGNDSTKHSNTRAGIGKTIKYVVMMVLFGAFVWFFLVPPLIGQVASRVKVELKDINILNITNDGVIVKADVEIPIPSFLDLEIEFERLELFAIDINDSEAKTFDLYSYSINADNDRIGSIEFGKIKLAKYRNDLSVKSEFKLADQRVLSRFISSTIEAALNKNTNRFPKVKAKGVFSLKVGGMQIEKIHVTQVVDAKLPSEFSTFTINETKGPYEDEGDLGLIVKVCGEIGHSFGQEQQVELPPMRFGMHYKDQKLLSIVTTNISYGLKTASVCVWGKVEPIRNVLHEMTIGEFLSMVLSKKPTDFRIRGEALSDFFTFPPPSFSDVPYTESNDKELEVPPSWIVGVVENVSINMDTHILEESIHKTPINVTMPKFDLKSISGVFDGKVNNGFEPEFGASGSASIRFPFGGLINSSIKVKRLAGSFTFMGLSNPIDSPDNRIMFELANIPHTEVPIISSWKNGSLETEFNLSNLKVEFNKEDDTLSRVEKWFEATIISKTLTGYLVGEGSVTIQLLGGVIQVYTTAINFPVLYYFGKPPSSGEDSIEGLQPQIQRIEILESTNDIVNTQIDVEIINDTIFSGYLSDAFVEIYHNNSRLFRVGIVDSFLKRGEKSLITFDITLYHYNNSPLFRDFIYTLSSGNQTNIDIRGYKSCSSVAPIEMALRHIDIPYSIHLGDIEGSSFDLNSKLSPSSNSAVNSRPLFPTPIVQSVALRLFSMTVQATVVNPASGNNFPIRILSVMCTTMYNGTAIGTASKDFRHYKSDGTLDLEKAVLLVYNTPVTTPRIPIKPGDSNYIWKIIREYIGGKISTTNDVNIDVAIGNTVLTIHALVNNTPFNVGL